MTQLLHNLGDHLDFETYRNEIQPKQKMTETFDEEAAFVEQLMDLPEPAAYVEHTNWINFTEHNEPRPIYINMVRHPIQKVMSAYYYRRTPLVFANSIKRNPKRKMQPKAYFDTSFNECVRKRIAPDCVFDAHNPFNGDWRRFSLHLCGNSPFCEQFNSLAATQIAKRNIEQEYAVVGSWEDTNITLAVLEAYIPRFFTDATRAYYSMSEKFTINATPHDVHLDEDVEATLKMQFGFEIELYNFCKQRLYTQYIAINQAKMAKLYEPEDNNF